MASDTGPDLQAAVEAVEALMIDACIITRSGAGTLDEETGVVSEGDSDVYNAASLGNGGRSLSDEEGTGGKCMLSSPMNSGIPAVLTEGGVPRNSEPYRLAVPLDAPEIKKGDVVTIASSLRVPGIVGDVFHVRRVIEKSFSASRRIILEER